MSIQHIRCSNYVQITNYECAIQAKWNSFESIEDAKEYLEKNLLHKPGEYGFVVSKHDLWKYIP